MTKFQEFWSRIILANPGFGEADNTVVTMTVGVVRTLLAKAHKDGFHSALSLSKSLEGLGVDRKPDEDFLDLLKKMGC